MSDDDRGMQFWSEVGQHEQEIEMSTKPEGLALLREPFPPNQISLLPKPTAKREIMDTLPKATCQVCGGYHATSRVIHLSYVGHAALTDRLLDADPTWTWEPLSMIDGLPVLDGFGGMWIRLTVMGVTRLGYGHAGEKSGGDAIKEVIGDALRNAAMRFGAALELWHKGELHVEKDEGSTLENQLEASIDQVKAKKRREALDEIALDIIEAFHQEKHGQAIKLWFDDTAFESQDERAYCWGLLKTESALRALLQANSPHRDHREAPAVERIAPGPGLKKVGRPVQTQ